MTAAFPTSCRRIIAAALFGMIAPAFAQDVTVFAAVSLTNALEAIAKAYRDRGGESVRFSFAASSTLAKQIEGGADADVFVSADEAWMDYLAARGLIEPATRTSRLGNTLVLVAPLTRRAVVDIKPGFDLARLIGEGRLATGDPAHVPVGRYAQQALTTLGVWPAVERKLARADNVRAALLFVERGDAQFGIVYATDAAASNKVRIAGEFPPGSHTPVTYPMAIVTRHDRPEVRRFFQFLVGPDAQEVFRRTGFSWR